MKGYKRGSSWRKAVKRGVSLLLCLLLLSTCGASLSFAQTEALDGTSASEEVDTTGEEQTESLTGEEENVDLLAEKEAEAVSWTEEEPLASEKEETDAEDEAAETRSALPAADNSISAISADSGASVAAVGGNPGSGGSTATTTIRVYYDTVTLSGSSTTPTLTAQNSTTGVESVTVGGTKVAHANGAAQNISSSQSTATLTYDTANPAATTTITVTPAEGYYVTFIAVCCCGSGAAQSCTTYSGGNAYSGSFTIESAGAVSVEVVVYDEEGFHHSSNSSSYFVMVAVAKIPTPLYVEYDYGDIVSLIGDATASSAFSTANGWTTTADGNSYGTTDSGVTNGVMTSATQYKYTYASNSTSAAAGWLHYANAITDEAKAQAAAAGYYFAGWEATYYTSCDVSESADGYNSYSYLFSSQYGSTSDYLQEGDGVPLTVHVKLTAIWVKAEITPGTLTITKSFEGLDEAEYPETIIVTVTKEGETGFTEQSVTLSASNNWTATISNLYAGTYRLTETGYEVAGYSCSTAVNGSAQAGATATVILSAGTITSRYNSATGLYEYYGSISNGTASFVNSYVLDVVTLELTKIIAGNMADLTRSFSFTVTYTDPSGEERTKVLTLGGNETSEAIPVKKGSEVCITEKDSDSYTVTAMVNGEEVSVARGSLYFTISEDSEVVVTNIYEVTVDTGIGLDSAPYLLLLGTAFAGLLLLQRRRWI